MLLFFAKTKNNKMQEMFITKYIIYVIIAFSVFLHNNTRIPCFLFVFGIYFSSLCFRIYFVFLVLYIIKYNNYTKNI